jgi:hypothetical protein
MTEVQLAADNQIRRTQLVELLQQHTVQVTFTKVTGELRSMPCTLKADLLPATAQSTTQLCSTQPKQAVLTAWVTDQQAWRSFRIDSVISVSI